MNFRQLGISRRTVAVVAGLLGMVSLAIGAHAALNKRALDRLKSRVRPDSVVMLFFGGYGVQAGRESYMVPVDARIWKESDIRREGISVESVLEDIKERGAR